VRIDSHHHLWHYSENEYPWINEQMSVLRRDFTVTDLLRETQAAGIEGVVSVQARQTLEETHVLLEIAQNNPFIKAVVGWVPLAAHDLREQLEQLAEFPRLKAVRHVVQDEPDDAFILAPAFNAGVALLAEFGLVYDILIFARHLPNTLEFVARHPNQAFVLDHIAKPIIQAQRFDESWASNLRQLARYENITCKFSALVTEVRDPQWSVDLLRPYWDVALEAFGPSRMMFGSDWPVCLLRSSYANWVSAVEELASDLTQAEQLQFWGETARRAYHL
jgi:L-fuconolactonase